MELLVSERFLLIRVSITRTQSVPGIKHFCIFYLSDYIYVLISLPTSILCLIVNSRVR